MKLRISLLGLAAALVLVAGCGDSNPFRAQFPTELDTYTLFALTGTPAAYPSGLNTFSRAVTRVDGNANFDLAFDINSDGNAIIYPVKLIVSAVTGDRVIGLKKVALPFDSIMSAPKGKYQADSAVVLAAGESLVIEANRGSSGDVCYLNLSPNVYSKLTVTSIDLVTRTIEVESVLDPNCGFRSFAIGLPTS